MKVSKVLRSEINKLTGLDLKESILDMDISGATVRSNIYPSTKYDGAVPTPSTGENVQITININRQV